MNNIIYSLSLLFLFTACKHTPDTPRNEISKISLSENVKITGHPRILTIDIDSSLTYRFDGIAGCGKDSGVITGKISREEWDSLNSYLQKINYKALDSSYNNIGVLEDTRIHLGLEFKIYYGKKRKRIVANAYGPTVAPPQALVDLEYYLTRPIFKKTQPMPDTAVQD